MVTAALRADSADAAIYARVLTQSLGDSLPAGCVTVDRDRTMSDRMHGRPGTVTKVTVRLGERVMTLGVQRGAPVAEVCREVRGVVLSRQPVARRPVGGRAGQGAGGARGAECRCRPGAAQARGGQLGRQRAGQPGAWRVQRAVTGCLPASCAAPPAAGYP